jgi:heme A synthase
VVWGLLFHPQSRQTKVIASLLADVLFVSLAVFLIVAGLVTFCLLRRRAPAGAHEPRQHFGSHRIELLWTMLPAMRPAREEPPDSGMKNPSLHRCAVIVAACVMALLLTGAAVTSTEGLPTAASPGFHGAPLIEAGIDAVHRVSADVAALALAALVIWVFLKERHAGLRLLAGIILISCVVEALLGSRGELASAHPMIGVLHAFVGQLLFTATVSMAIFTSPTWNLAAEVPTDAAQSSLRPLGLVIPALVLLQVVLGAAYRHRAMGVILHILNAMIVTLLIFVAGMLVTRNPATTEMLRRAAVALMAIAGIQVMLGFAVFILLLMFPENNLSLVLTSVAHVATGALTLAASVIFAIQIRRDARVASPVEGGATAVRFE